MTEQPAVVGGAELDAAMVGLPDWRALLGSLGATYVAPSAAAALALIAAIGAAAEAANHHPDLDWRYDHIFIRTTTHQVGGDITARDIDLAQQISKLAAEMGATAEPGLLRTIEIGVDTADPDALRPTWQAALGYRPGRMDDLVDPWGRGPSVWFQQTQTPATSRLHLDVHVAPEDASTVLGSVEAAGGLIVDDRFAPSWWVGADADGNRICICTPREAPSE